MRRQLYQRVEEYSQYGEPSGGEAEPHPQTERELVRKRRNSKIYNDIPTLTEKPKRDASLLDRLQARTDNKIRPQNAEPGFNTTDMIRVLNGGREKRLTLRNVGGYNPGEEFSLDQTPTLKPVRSVYESSKDPKIEAVSVEQIDARIPNARERVAGDIVNKLETQRAENRIRKVIGNMREEQLRQDRLKYQNEWKEIEDLITSKSDIEIPINTASTNISTKGSYKPKKNDQQKEEKKKQKEKEQQKQKEKGKESLKQKPDQKTQQQDATNRRYELDAAKQLLTGKVSIIWIFVLSSKSLTQDERNRIVGMYSGLTDQSNLVPLCSRAAEVKTFLEVPHSLFKIVADMENFAETIKCKGHPKVVEFYVYNNKGEQGITKALSYKAESRKVKGIFSELKKIVDRAEEQIQSEIQLFQTKKGLAKKNKGKKFPSFLKLSGEDKTWATLYRGNLYGAKNIPRHQLMLRYRDFMQLVVQRYGDSETEKANVTDYQNIDHFEVGFTMLKAREVLKFYVRESFYYQILNSMLRTMKTTQQFKPCIFPFYENYQAVKKLYELNLRKNDHSIAAQTLYRGAKLKQRDLGSLKPGAYIEMFGFMSTSKKIESAKQFCGRDGVIFVIEVPAIRIDERLSKYDHGFVDINQNSLATGQYAFEEEVLFNCLNVFKVTRLEKQGGREYIHLEYGAIFGLMLKQRKQLSSDQRDVLLNYQYCAQMLDEIEDQGDVHLLANELEESKEYYQQKISQDSREAKYFYKLANVQQQTGELDDATKNINISLKLQTENLDLADREKCLKVFSIHCKNAQISLDQEDYLMAESSLNEAIVLLDQNSDLEKGKKFRERGEVKFKKGEVKDAERDFEISENILKSLTNKAQEQRKTINKDYFFSFLKLLCISSTKDDLEKEREQKLREVETLQKEIRNTEDVIEDQLIKVNNSLKEVAHYVQDKQKYEICVKKARAYLLGVQSRKTNDVMEKAKLKMLEATIQDYLELAESERLLYEAIELIESQEPFNTNVGRYSEILANIQKRELEKFSNPKQLFTTKIKGKLEPIKFNKQQQNAIYIRCRKNFEKAINVLLYNQKSKSCLEIISLKNQIGELDFYQSKFESSEKIIKEAKESYCEGGHSEISRSNLLLSKISFARGELRCAFENVEEAIRVLRVAIVKKEDPKYLAVFESNDLYLEIKMHRSKIFLKQFKHDLSLKDLNEIKSVIDRKIDYRETHCLIGDIFEQRAENYLALNKEYESEFEKAIKQREKQIGEVNLANAITYCNFAKSLILTKQLGEADKMIQKALEIFSCFSSEHPINWLVLYCTGLLKERMEQYDDSLNCIGLSLERAQQKYDRSHITISKIRLQHAKMLQKASKYDQAIRHLEDLEVDLEDELTASQARATIKSEQDDQKITVKKYLFEYLRESYQERNNVDTTVLNETTRALGRCERKMSELRKTYSL